MKKVALKLVDGQMVERPLTLPDRTGLPHTARIQNLQDVKRDAIRVYRAGRQGKIDSAEVSRWMFSISRLSDVIERADVEPRVAAIEARIEAIAKRLML